MDAIVNIFQLFPYALIIGLLMSIIAPLYGINVILKRIIIASLSLPQVAVMGVAIGQLLGIPDYITSITATVLAGLLLSYPFEKFHISREGIAVFIFLLSSSVTYLIINFSNLHFNDVKQAIYGNFLIVNKLDCIVYCIFFIISIVYFVKFIRPSIYITTDYIFAQSLKINVPLMELLYFIMLSLFISLSTKAVGTILSFSNIIIPVYFSFIISNKFKTIFLAGVLFTFFSTFSGIYFSYILDVSTSELIIVFQIVLFLLTVIIKKMGTVLLFKK